MGLVAMLLGAPSALGAPTYQYSGTVGKGAFTNEGPRKVAVDYSTGNVLAVDALANHVLVFGSDGSLLTEFGATSLLSPWGIAIDQSNGDVYVADAGHKRIARYLSDGNLPPTYTLDQTYAGPAAGSGAGQVGDFGAPLAIDPSNGDLLVADKGNHRVSRYDSSGAFIASFNGAGTETGVFAYLLDLAVDPAGHIYVLDVDNTFDPFTGVYGTARLEQFSSTGTSERVIKADAPESVAASLAFDTKRENLIVGLEHNNFNFRNIPRFQIFHQGVPAGEVVFPEALSGSGLPGLTYDGGSGSLYVLTNVYAGGGYGGVAGLSIFKSVFVPELTLNPPTNVTSVGAHVAGTVFGGGKEHTFYRFEYSSDGGSSWSTTPSVEAGTGGSPEVVEADLTLEPNLQYAVRLRAFNTDEATNAVSATETLKTLQSAPAATTTQASDRSRSGATLRGAINPFGLQTTYHFEYGTTAAYGAVAPAEHEAVAGNGHSRIPVFQSVTGLQAGTTYHYRLVAKNSFGVEEGDDKTFTTQQETVAARSFELVSPAEKGGVNVDSGYGYQASEDGDMLTYFGKGVLAGQGSESAPADPRYLARRDGTGWFSKATDPPQSDRGQNAVVFTMAVSQDGTKALVISTKKLAAGGADGDSNLYLRDLATDEYTTVASVPGRAFWADQVSAFAAIFGLRVFVAGTPDFSHLLLTGAGNSEPIELIPGTPDHSLYEYAGGQLHFVSVDPAGAPLRFNAPRAQEHEKHRMSRDGSRIFFRDGSEVGAVYVRVNGATRLISESHRTSDLGTAKEAFFLGADADGTEAYIAARDLTEDSEPGALTLYRYRVDSGELEMLTPTRQNVSDLQGTSDMEVNQTGESVYFASSADLLGDAVAGGKNIYVWRKDALARVASVDTSFGEVTDFKASENGRYLVFRTRKLADGPDLGSGQIYRYDADQDELACASCRPDGEPGPGLASIIGVQSNEIGNTWFPRAVSDRGQVFFDTPEALVAKDANSVRDVYEYDGSDVRLISPGSNRGAAARFSDASADGRNVFFSTQDRLVGIDRDSATDVYDARIDGGLASQNPPPPREECIRDDCKATPNVGPELPFGGSEGLNGPQNLNEGAKKRCGKGRHARRVKGKQRCVKQHQKNQTNRKRRQGR